MSAYSLSGELTIHHASEQHVVLRELLNKHADEQVFELDLSGVEEMDSAGIQLLLALRKTLQSHHSELRLTQSSAAVTLALDTYGLNSLDLNLKGALA